MSDDPTSEPAAAPPTPPSPAPPATRRPLLWVALGAAALGVAGGGAAAVALTDDAGSDRLAVATASEGDADADAEATPAEGDADAEAERPDRGEHRRPGAHGAVTGVDGTTVTIEDDEGEATTVTTDDETQVLDVAEGEAADIAEGDSVVVMGEVGEDDGVTAARVVDLGTLDPAALHPGRPGPADEGAPADPAEGEHPGRFRPTVGTVAAVDGATVTVTTDDGDVVVTATDDTQVTVVTEIAVSDLAEGDAIAARGETDDAGTVAAEVVIRGELDGRPGPGFGPGGPGGPGGGGHHPRGERQRG